MKAFFTDKFFNNWEKIVTDNQTWLSPVLTQHFPIY